MNRRKAIKDSLGVVVKAGDVVCFTYGIPVIGVNAPVVERDGKLIVITKGHVEGECDLKDLRKYVGDFYIEQEVKS